MKSWRPREIDSAADFALCCSEWPVADIYLWQHQKNSPANDKTSPAPPVKVTAAPVKPIVIVPGSPTPQSVTQAVEQATPKKPTRPKSLSDLKVGKIELKKTTGNSLVYAIGTMKNDSDYDRYGVRLSWICLNAKGTKIGAANYHKDYIGSVLRNGNFACSSLNPRQPKPASPQ